MTTTTDHQTPVPDTRDSTRQPAVQVDDLRVTYRLPETATGSIKEHVLHCLTRRLRYRDFQALNGVSFSVQPGEVFGIIGPNGAGKTTLLQVISRVLRPSAGRVQVRGRVAPLLGLGAGFHPELSGLENIHLNGALLGMERSLIAERLPAIVEFSEIGDFIEAPIRTYSNGMMARLAFSVACTLEPDVLVLDEVLAVGDQGFREKSMARIEAMVRSDITVVIVSHSMQTVDKLCDRVAWLEHGKLRSLGPASEVVLSYIENRKQDNA